MSFCLLRLAKRIGRSNRLPVPEGEGEAVLSGQQPPLQQGAQVAAAVGDEEDVDVVFGDAVEDAVGFEPDFAVVADSHLQQFGGEGAPVGQFGEPGDGVIARTCGARP